MEIIGPCSTTTSPWAALCANPSQLVFRTEKPSQLAGREKLKPNSELRYSIGAASHEVEADVGDGDTEVSKDCLHPSSRPGTSSNDSSRTTMYLLIWIRPRCL